jgi:hypothetical protein
VTVTHTLNAHRVDRDSHTLNAHRVLSGIACFFEHAAFVVLGVVMMIVGLGLGVTMVLLPLGLTIGLLGVAVFVGGLFARINSKA